MSADSEDVAVLVNAVKEMDLEWQDWPGGWPGEVDAALIDAVLSIRAHYGQRHNGVRGAIKRLRDERGGDSLDDLNRLAAATPDELAGALGNQQRLPGGSLKVQAIVEAARDLVAEGVRCASDVDPTSRSQKRTYTSVRGLGEVTWEYLLMLLGRPGVKADTWIVRFVESTLARPVSSWEAREIMIATAKKLGVAASTLDHTVWKHMRQTSRTRRV